MLRTLVSLSCCSTINAIPEQSTIHPLTISGKHFVDSVTSDRFFLRGIDYQPGGSAAYDRRADPLSDVDQCARDIYLLQELGVNTLRVYTVNPHLNHDDCMTMLAAAGIYLVLDVNSPLVAESINRYEPWTTYTPTYLSHVFEVVDQFSRYNNTLGFFIGNEIVNDERSASVSPPFIRAVARDVKDYMYYNCPRQVPVGYSAADDLRYRIQLPHYLTCGDQETALDFYGVNSYQWCGKQTITTSGYDILIKDHQDLDFPVFFSEFGCNHIQPRIFQEVEAIFSPEMTSVFEGGLVYEFSQEANDYGLVFIDKEGDAHLREEFFTLKAQFEKVKTALAASSTPASEKNTTASSTSPIKGNQTDSLKMASLSSEGAGSVAITRRSGQRHGCLSFYSNLSGASKAVPDSFGTDMIRNGVRVVRGKYNPLILEDMPQSSHAIYDPNGEKRENYQIKVVNQFDPTASYSSNFRSSTPSGKESVQFKNKKNSGKGKTTKKNSAPALHGLASRRSIQFAAAFFMFLLFKLF